jgi:hypothetical protein
MTSCAGTLDRVQTWLWRSRMDKLSRRFIREIRRNLVASPNCVSLEPCVARARQALESIPDPEPFFEFGRLPRAAGIADRGRSVVQAVDGVDVCHRHVPVRGREQTVYTDDFLVQSEILRCLLAALPGTSREDRDEVLRHLAQAPQPWAPARLLLGTEAFERGAYARAIETARRILSVHSVSPAPQRLLHRALLKLREAEESAVASADIAMHDLRDRFCPAPFTTFNSCSVSDAPGARPSVYGCPCNAWQPYAFDGFRAPGTWEEIWNGPIAREIRRSIHDGDFTYCSRVHCPQIVRNTLPKTRDLEDDPAFSDIIRKRATRVGAVPTTHYWCHDRSCNLA